MREDIYLSANIVVKNSSSMTKIEYDKYTQCKRRPWCICDADKPFWQIKVYNDMFSMNIAKNTATDL